VVASGALTQHLGQFMLLMIHIFLEKLLLAGAFGMLRLLALIDDSLTKHILSTT
jgi:hypothetical protein